MCWTVWRPNAPPVRPVLKQVADRAPEELREEVGQAQEATRAGLDEIRRIARRLRPAVLEELGPASALRRWPVSSPRTG